MKLEEKTKIRQQILKKLKLQREEHRLQKSLVIKKRLFETFEFKSANTIMFYISIGCEVETRPMIEEALNMGKRVAVPVTNVTSKKIIACEIKDLKTQLCEGPYGIQQPKKEYIKKIPINDIDLVITPGIAFDKKGNRLGRGAGYYDRFFKEVPDKTPRVGLAFDFQVVEEIPTLSHDIRITRLITN